MNIPYFCFDFLNFKIWGERVTSFFILRTVLPALEIADFSRVFRLHCL